jgi:hypothetical protein
MTPRTAGITLMGLLGLSLALAAPARAEEQATVKVDTKDGLGNMGQHTQKAASFQLGSRRSRIAAPEQDEVLKFEKQRLSPNVVSSVIKKNRKPLRDCYASAVARSSTPVTGIAIRFVVEPKGHTSGVVVEAEGGRAAQTLRKCMSRVVKGWRFPKADAETPVDYPFVFDIAGTTLAEPDSRSRTRKGR